MSEIRKGVKAVGLGEFLPNVKEVPGAGVEPARLAALVFETSASTDSAIRANVLRGFGDLLPREAYAPIDTFFSKGLQR